MIIWKSYARFTHIATLITLNSSASNIAFNAYYRIFGWSIFSFVCYSIYKEMRNFIIPMNQWFLQILTS